MVPEKPACEPEYIVYASWLAYYLHSWYHLKVQLLLRTLYVNTVTIRSLRIEHDNVIYRDNHLADLRCVIYN
jgi:hypothetical protein